ncbi:oxalate decarboxylase family bicupin [Candidatus Solirubrobacter pratensis]|uniref:oxalate decarboxylase family bicupin n=1 Tax=Candidatus Solirubrobacter pratensis TaxID=1298857 RepID=UPI0004823926
MSRADDAPQPLDGDEGGTILGPRNEPLERENPDRLLPPTTDAGYLPNLKFSFDIAHTRVSNGGWARQVTVDDFPIAKTISGVDMRLKPGAIRELHWHDAAEWSLMLAGNARITAMDFAGRNFVADVGKDDLWLFPAGVPHSIQALDEGCEFLLVFDDGAFSEFGTFLLTDWIAHTPRSILAKNFGVPESAFDRIPADIESKRYIFPAEVPGSLRSSEVHSPAGTIKESYVHRLSDTKPIDAPGGRVRIVDSSNFPAAKTIAAAIVEVDPGGMRELHWHPNADEWQYYVSGKARMTVFGAEGTANTFDYQAGDVGYVPFPMGHYVENTGTAPLRFLEMFRAPRFEDVSLNQWLALSPVDLVRAHVPVDRRFISALSKRKQIVVRY